MFASELPVNLLSTKKLCNQQVETIRWCVTRCERVKNNETIKPIRAVLTELECENYKVYKMARSTAHLCTKHCIKNVFDNSLHRISVSLHLFSTKKSFTRNSESTKRKKHN